MGEFLMPSLGADMDEGTVVEWRVKVGDEVHRGDIVAVVDTDKSDIDVEIFESGVIDELLVPEGERVAVGTPLARLHAVGAAVAAPAAPVPVAAPPAAPSPVAGPAPVAAAPAAVAATPAAVGTELHSPVLRRLAAHLGVDLATVHGTGPDGRVTRADIEAAAAGAATVVAAPREPAVRPEPSGRPERAERGVDREANMRRAIGDLMARSKREIPHYYVADDLDVGAALAHLTARNAQVPVAERVLPAALLLKAAALAAHAVPDLNGTYVDGTFRAGAGVHLGVAVRLRGGGLVAPALHDADTLPLDELMRRLQDLVARARAGRLRSSEMSDPTLTVTNLGDQGVDTVYGVVYPPQVALLGLGRIRERPWAVDGMIGVRPVLRATLAADHRVTDGIVGARFLRTFDRLLQEPEAL